MNNEVVTENLVVLPLVTVMQGIQTSYGVVWALALLLGIFFVRGCLRLQGTTLTAPCLWALAAIVALACVPALDCYVEPAMPPINRSALQFAAVALTFCPIMAVLGAKRPQHRGWQWVVFSLWIVIVWPAAQAVILPQGLYVELFIAWKLFLAGLISIGLMNYLPTRFASAALLTALGQIVLLDDYLGNFANIDSQWTLAVGLGCFTCAAILASRPDLSAKSFLRDTAQRVLAKEQRQTIPDDKETGDLSPHSLASSTIQWRRFRDAFGAFWSLRILGQINQNAEVRKWPMRLHWSGFIIQESLPTDQQIAELEQQMATLLRRFV